MEAITAGNAAFGLSSQDKADLGLGRATPRSPPAPSTPSPPTPIAEGTVIARKNPDNTYTQANIQSCRAILLAPGEDRGPATPIPTAAFNNLL